MPGYGGAAVLLRRQIVPTRSPEGVATTLAFDVGLLSPDRFTQYLARQADSEFIDRFARFLFSAASDFHPEKSLPTFTDHAMGLTVSAMSSTDERVEIEVTVIQELDADVLDSDTVNFETSRAVLATAAQQIRSLDGSWDQANLDLEP